jgi:hypothetical protein
MGGFGRVLAWQVWRGMDGQKTLPVINCLILKETWTGKSLDGQLKIPAINVLKTNNFLGG